MIWNKVNAVDLHERDRKERKSGDRDFDRRSSKMDFCWLMMGMLQLEGKMAGSYISLFSTALRERSRLVLCIADVRAPTLMIQIVHTASRNSNLFSFLFFPFVSSFSFLPAAARSPCLSGAVPTRRKQTFPNNIFPIFYFWFLFCISVLFLVGRCCSCGIKPDRCFSWNHAEVIDDTFTYCRGGVETASLNKKTKGKLLKPNSVYVTMYLVCIWNLRRLPAALICFTKPSYW